MAGRKKKEENISIEDIFEKVEETISALQEEDISLEDSFRKYKEGMELLKAAGEQIDRVEKEALVIEENGDLTELDDIE
ncbi:exodeoxyribonuclease VII small subunit [Butyrivibrio sp. MC2013]|uniref:exodeoxyribonuclease VII small subunit n=1 Tax=Butyrivibrio sp. MC2013 TaxID=1280686 RepID=UPI000422DD20|nr:exodeoxyribonuclease VII small subunit [Butyrivibrio sp. MC2013]